MGTGPPGSHAARSNLPSLGSPGPDLPGGRTWPRWIFGDIAPRYQLCPVGASLARMGSVGSDVLVDLPVLHDEADVLGHPDVFGWVARHCDDVGQEAGCELSQVVRPL